MKKTVVLTLLFMIFLSATAFGVPLDKMWKVEFTDKVQASSLKKGLIYIYDHNYNKIPTHFSLSEDSKFLHIEPEVLLSPDSNYNIYINKSIRSQKNVSLSKDFIFPFKTDKLSGDNIDAFTQIANENFVDITYTDGSSTSKHSGFLVYDSNINKTFVYTYYPYDINPFSFYVSHNGNNLSGTISNYDEDTDILVLDISTSVSSHTLMQKDYSQDNTFFTTLTSNGLKVYLNESGKFYAISKEDSTQDVVSELSNDTHLNLPFNKFRAIKDTLLPPRIVSSTFNALENSINLKMDTNKDFVIYFSKNSDEYSPLNDMNGDIAKFSGNNITLDLSRFSSNIDEKDFELYMKIYSSESGELSTNFAFCILDISKISEEDRILSIVKNGKFNVTDQENIGDSFSSFFRSSRWEVKYGNEVHFWGNGFYKGSYANIQFIFTVELSNNTFRLEEVYKNNYPLNYNELPNLINSITEN